MKYKMIKSEKEYEAALGRLEEIFDTEQNTNEGQEALLIKNYEEQHHKIGAPDPIVAVSIRTRNRSTRRKR